MLIEANRIEFIVVNPKARGRIGPEVDEKRNHVRQ